MILEYIWIDQFKKLNEKSICLSNRFDINCVKNDKIFYVTIKQKKNEIPENFFSEYIDNISAIVGKNASGKTSILDYIFDGDQSNNPYLAFYFDKKDNRLWYGSNREVEIQNESKYDVNGFNRTGSINNDNIIDSYMLQYKSKQAIKFIKCSLEFSPVRKDINIVENYSNAALKDYDDELIIFKKNGFDELVSYSISEILNLLYSTRINEIEEINDFILPEKLVINFPDLNGSEKFTNSEKTHPFFTHEANRLLGRIGDFKKNKDKLLTLIMIRYFEVMRILTFSDTNNYNYDDTIQSDSDYSDQFNHIRKIVIPDLEKLKSEKKVEIKFSMTHLKSITDIFKLLILEIDLLDVPISYYGKPNRFQIIIDRNRFNSNLLRVLNVIITTDLIKDNVLNVDWYGLSDGQTNLLKTFSKIYRFIKKTIISNVSFNCDSALILIDEADNSLHPELARRFIYLLTTFTDVILSEYNKVLDVQYVITTHSPFIISDLPFDNCVFLDSYEEGAKIEYSKTFSSNIYTLLNNSFFMDKYSGEFSSRKIIEVMNIINNDNYSRDKELVDYIINIVGEPVIKKIIINTLKTKGNKYDKY